jgi:hypothetical protein
MKGSAASSFSGISFRNPSIITSAREIVDGFGRFAESKDARSDFIKSFAGWLLVNSGGGFRENANSAAYRTADCCRHDTTGKTPAVFKKRVKPSAQK